eukprot:6404689-Pyramimonas_sp.AAC.1
MVVGAEALLPTLRRCSSAVISVLLSGVLAHATQNKMPGFGEGCAPKGSCTFAARLSDDVIRQLAQYTLDQAHTGWQP